MKDSKGNHKTLVIHIGDHKTGSTTLQNAFATQSVHLKDRELLYPARLNHNYLLGHFRSAAAGEKPPVGTPEQPGLVMLQELIKESRADYILLSGEEFENIQPQDFKRVVDEWFMPLVSEVRVIAYARPHAARFVSNFTELVKIGAFQGSLEDYLEKIQNSGRFDFAPRFEAWRVAFGGAFALRPMIREKLTGGSVVNDFIAAAFDGADFTLDEIAADNESVGLRELMLLKFVQARFKGSNKFLRHTMGREIVRYLGQFTEGGTRSEKVALHASLAAELGALYRADAEALDQAFFAGQSLFADALESSCRAAKQEPVPLEPEDYFSLEELRRLTALRETLWGMLQKPQNWAAVFHRNRIDALHKEAVVTDTQPKVVSSRQDTAL